MSIKNLKKKKKKPVECGMDQCEIMPSTSGRVQRLRCQMGTRNKVAVPFLLKFSLPVGLRCPLRREYNSTKCQLDYKHFERHQRILNQGSNNNKQPPLTCCVCLLSCKTDNSILFETSKWILLNKSTTDNHQQKYKITKWTMRDRAGPFSFRSPIF